MFKDQASHKCLKKHGLPQPMLFESPPTAAAAVFMDLHPSGLIDWHTLVIHLVKVLIPEATHLEAEEKAIAGE